MVLGIDPPHGFALVEKGKWIDGKTVHRDDFLFEVAEYLREGEVDLVIVEMPPKVSTYHRFKALGPKERAAVARDVGRCEELAKQAVVVCKRMKVEVLEVFPSTPKPGKLGNTKWPEPYWRGALDYWKPRLPSEHARDAATHAFLQEQIHAVRMASVQSAITPARSMR
jgi:hypothetical protein